MNICYGRICADNDEQRSPRRCEESRHDSDPAARRPIVVEPYRAAPDAAIEPATAKAAVLTYFLPRAS
jgi:hypothetical protein